MSGINTMVEQAFAQLDENSQPGATAEALRALAKAVAALDEVSRGLITTQAVDKLKKLGLASADTVRTALAPSKPSAGGSEQQLWPNDLPDPEGVNLGSVLDEASRLIARHMVLPRGAAEPSPCGRRTPMYTTAFTSRPTWG